MRKTAITRRKLVKTLLALGAWSVFPAPLSPVKTSGSVMAAIGGTAPSTETFAAVSTFVTLHDDFSADAVARMFDVFKDEPWALEHIDGIHSKVSTALQSDKRPPLKDPSWHFTEGESWFAGHLLTTWYLGIYYHQDSPTRRILYEDALVFSATRDIMPIPYLEPVGFGAWSHPPQEAK